MLSSGSRVRKSRSTSPVDGQEQYQPHQDHTRTHVYHARFDGGMRAQRRCASAVPAGYTSAAIQLPDSREGRSLSAEILPVSIDTSSVACSHSSG